MTKISELEEQFADKYVGKIVLGRNEIKKDLDLYKKELIAEVSRLFTENGKKQKV